MKKTHKVKDLWLNRLLILSLVLLQVFLLLFILVDVVKADEIHLGDLSQLCPLDAGPDWITDIGVVIHTTCEDGRGQWWVLYKGIDLNHSGVHVRPLTPKQAKSLLEVK